MFKSFKTFLTKKVNSIGLSIFRIFYGISLFFEVLFMYQYKELFFDTIPFLEPGELDVSLPLLIWMSVILCIIAGFKSRLVTVLNYFFTLVFISSLTSFEYHIHYVYIGVNFILMFLPLSNQLSVDKYLGKESNNYVYKIYYLLPLFLGIALIYFDSVLFKLTSEIWMNGLGMWYPASLPQITIAEPNFILENKHLCLFLGYLTLVFEIVFPFLFWLKRFRLPLLIIGLGLHLGILFSYPIPLFALAMINVYLLLVPISFWIKILSFFKIKPLNNDQPIKSVASFKQLSLIIFVALFFQMNTSINHSSLTRPYVFKLYNKLGIANEVDILSRKIRDFSSKTMGIFSHGVFIDKHFKGYNHIISVSYMNNGVEEWLPLINKKGMPGEMNRGANWAKLTWRTNECLINQGKLKAGIIDFCTYWAIINDKSLSGDSKFIIRVKKVELPKEYKWQKDFLKNQIDQPWSVVGSLQFHNEEPLIEILDIESF